jgi:serine/threonine-protein kinase HipA
MPDPNCLICYLPLEGRESGEYHASCCQRFFGTSKPPELPYGIDELAGLAEKVVRSQVTVPGVQEKISLHLPQGGGHRRFTIVGLWGNYILKPPVKQYPEMPEIEGLTMHLAEVAGIRTVPHALIRLKSGELAYITRRVDRGKKGEKYYMEDMCQLTERLTEDKYKGSMEQVGKTILRFSSNPGFDALVHFDIAVFSFLTGNADMHLKNFSLLQKNNLITLAPAYDLVATRLLISEKDDPEEMALTLNGKKSKLKLQDFESFAQNIGLTREQIRNSLKRLIGSRQKMNDLILNSRLSEAKKFAYKDLIAERTERLSGE